MGWDGGRGVDCCDSIDASLCGTECTTGWARGGCERACWPMG